MAQQPQYGYGYGYGYAAANYGAQTTNFAAAAAPTVRPQLAGQQQAAYPALVAQVAPTAGFTDTKTSVAPVQQQQQQQQQQLRQQTPAVQGGFYQGQTGGSQQQPTSVAYYGYQQQQQQQYRPPQQQATPQQSGYYYQQHTPSATQAAAAAAKTTPTATPTVAHQGVGYGTSMAVAAALPAVAYPSSYSSPHYSSTAATSRYGGFSSGVKAQGTNLGYPTPSYTPSSASYPNTASYSSAQEKVIASYIAQKTTGGYGGGGGGGRVPNKKPYNPNSQSVYLCEVCKISCASPATYKTHLEGKAHKKKIQQQSNGGGGGGGGTEGGEGGGDKKGIIDRPYYCPLCEIQCTSKDSYEAHIRGARHTKTLNLYRRLGKAIPDIKLPEGSEITNTVSGKRVNVNVPRINFVGGKQLTSTGATGSSSGPPSLYPPGPGGVVDSAPTVVVKSEDGEGVEGEGVQETTTHDIEPVGEQFVVAVSNDPKFPHATYKCTMCDCYFNDDWAKVAHAKGRRHRLNYKKLYQPDLYVEPSKSNRKKSEKQRESKVSQGGGGAVRGGRGGGVRGGRGGGQQMDAEALRRMEAEELSKMQYGNMATQVEMGGEEMYMEVPPTVHHPHTFTPPHPHYEVEPPSHYYPPRPRNPRDDRLVMNKHGSICPLDSEMKAVEQAVTDVETVLKSISDDILDETCKTLSEEQETEVKRDEKHRRLKGVMRVGAFARSLMLRGECNVDLVLMCTGRPTAALFHDIFRQMPQKFEELSGDLVYNVSEEVGRAAILVISQVEEHRVQVTLTLTSTEMRELPSPEQSQADQEAGVLHHPSCSAALAALRHTKWFQMVAQGLPSCGILMRVLKDICRRVPAWGVLDSWILELLVQKNLMSANPDYTRPGDVFRRVMECVASGIFLPGGSGLQDPCEKGTMDASSCLSAQERVNITLSAQHALRLIAHGKAHLVLGVDPVPGGGGGARRERVGEREAAPENGEKTSEGGGGGGGEGGEGGRGEEGETAEPEIKRARVSVKKESDI